MRPVFAASLLAWLLLDPTAATAQKRAVPATGYRGWPIVAGGHDSLRYSALAQIDRTNVHRLKVAWSYDTGDAFQDSEMQCNPIIVDGVLYATSPRLRVFALDAATGRQIWSFEPPEEKGKVGKKRNRGVAHWRDGEDRRIFVAAGPQLFALDARTGRPIPSFGRNGRVDLREGLGRDPATLSVGANTPGVVYEDLYILGSVVPEALPAAPGDVRAFDVRTGKIRWSFHTIPHPGEPGHETWPRDAWGYVGGANNWSGMSFDEKRGLVFVPTGATAFDFYGGNRVGDNLYANSLIVLKAETGQRVWHFQFVKHDVWDRDLPAPPSLVTVRRNGKLVDAVAQVTKTGHVFVFERETGKPLFPIVYRKQPASTVDGEVLATTQPLPLKPPPFARQALTDDIVTDRTPEARKAVLEKLRGIKRGGPFEPPSLEGTIIFPGMDGGAEWGGAAFDPETGLLYVNSNEMAWLLRLVERKQTGGSTGGKGLYGTLCANCHRDDLKGNPPEFPSLVNIAHKLKTDQIREMILNGKGRMPGYGFLPEDAMKAVIGFVTSGTDQPVSDRASAVGPVQVRYGMDGYNKFLDPDKYPPVKPPWGTLNAIDLDKGTIRWSKPFGEIPALAARGMRNTGSENYGGPVVTAGGLVFIGATNYDKKFRAFDKVTGKVLWETTLPAAGNATPAVYEVGGRQFVVVGAGGGKSGQPSGGTYVAFALPQP